MSLTIEQILEKLELDDPKEFGASVMAARLAAGEEVDEPGRGTGRTTAMLVNAVFQSQFGLVAIRGTTATNSRILTYKARRMAVKCGIDGENLRSGHGVLYRQPGDFDWFADHTVPYKDHEGLPWLDKAQRP